MKIIVLNTTRYQESDIIVTGITEDQLISFKAKGALSSTYPFKWINNPSTVCDVEFVDSKAYKYPVLKRATLIDSPMSSNLSYQLLIANNLLIESINKMLDDEEKYLAFNFVLEAIDALKKENSDYLTIILIYLAKLIKLAGFELEVNACTHCGSTKDIVAFSFEDGGFICKHCLQESVNCDLTPLQMKLVRFIFKTPDFTYSIDKKIKEEDKKTLLFKINVFINDMIGSTIDSVNLILKD